MGKEQPPEYYDGIKYMKPEVYERYKPIYEAAADLLPPVEEDPIISDLGCGVGHFANTVQRRGYKHYYGVDSSPKMIEKAKANVKQPNSPYQMWMFHTYDILKSIQDGYCMKWDIFVLLEVLEHIEDDFKVLKSIPKGAQVIFSLPSFNATSHVRHFKNVQQIRDRYKKYFKFKNYQTIPWGKKNKVFLFDCVKR